MASRATGYWRSMLNRMGRNRSFASATASSAAHPEAAHRSRSKTVMTGEFAPVFVVAGMVLVAVLIGTHTMKQQLMHNPSVNVSKKRRESFPEVEDPDIVVASADKFVNNSFFRKVAHIQDNTKSTLRDPTRPDPFTRPRRAETLQSAGVDPKAH